MLRNVFSASSFDILIIVLAGFLAILLALAFHEAAHAFAAHKAGDLTPKAYGRLTLNPFKHLDTFGTISFLLLGFGWAKPVPVNPALFKHPKRDKFFVSVAGVLTNLILAFLTTPLMLLCFKWFGKTNNMLVYTLTVFLELFVVYNVNLAMFNLLPIHPLDGFNAVTAWSKGVNGYIRFMVNNGWIILLIFVALFSGWLSYLSSYIVWAFEKAWFFI